MFGVAVRETMAEIPGVTGAGRWPARGGAGGTVSVSTKSAPDPTPAPSGKDLTHSFNMDFGEALKALRDGYRVSRDGWNGPGMWLGLHRGYRRQILDEATSDAITLPVGTEIKVDPFILMRTARGSFVPWLASQTDVLARDWYVAL